MCTMLMGFFAVLSVASSTPAPQSGEDGHELQESLRQREVQDWFFLRKVWSCFEIIGIVFGYQGLQGLYARDAIKLKWLSCYYVLKFCLEVLSLCFYIANACQVLADFKPEMDKMAQKNHRKPMTCEEVRQLLFMQGIARCTMYYCFAKAVWGLSRIFSSLPAAPAWLGDFPTDIEAPLLASEERQQQRQQQQQPPRQQQIPKFQPFTGRPQRLD